jgi:SAM-dependent methyltransferase
MRSATLWMPTKFVIRGGRLRATRNTRHLSPSSRLPADLVAEFYDSTFPHMLIGDILDAGAGRVPLYHSYRDRSTSVTCVDVTVPSGQTDHLDKQADLNAAWPFEDDSFDTILMSDVLEHLWNPTEALAEATRVLRAGGVLILNTPFAYPIHESPHDYFRYTEFALKKIGQDAGLHVQHVEPIGGPIIVTLDTILKMTARVPGIGYPTVRIVTFILLQLMSISSVRRLLHVWKHVLPQGYGAVLVKPHPSLDLSRPGSVA